MNDKSKERSGQTREQPSKSTKFEVCPNSPEKSGHEGSENDSIQKLTNTLEERGFIKETKRIYRKAAHLPDPDRGPQAEANRLTKILQARVAPSTINEFEVLVQYYGSKRKAMEHIVKTAFDALPKPSSDQEPH